MGNVNMEASQINYRGGSKKMSVEEAIKAAGTEITPEEKEWIDTIPELASQEIIAPEFDAEEGVYAVGDLVIYQGGLYQFTTAHETAGAWNAEEVAAVKVSDELDSLKSGLNAKIEQITIDEVAGATLSDFILGVIGAITIGNGKLTVVYATYPLHDYYVFYIMRLRDDIYMFTANNTTKMYHGKAITGSNYVEVYEVTSTLVTN